MPYFADMNADIGEGMPYDAALMPYLTSGNIACGMHAGNTDIMKATIELCLKHGVAIGAHPSYPDRTHFGRIEMQMEPDTLREIITAQIASLDDLCKKGGAVLHHVKPHGALYNRCAANSTTARLIAQTVHSYNASLILYGLSGSYAVSEGAMAGLATAAEAFADRTYQSDGSLTPRHFPDALIEDPSLAAKQVLQIVTTQSVSTTSGGTVPVSAQTICIHGDGPRAVSIAQTVFNTLRQHGIQIQSFRA